MAQVSVKYNPYRLETFIQVNGRAIEEDSTLFKVVKGKRLQEWIGDFPAMLRQELNTVDLDLEFCGFALDWDDFEDAFLHAKQEGVLKNVQLKFIEGKSDDDIKEKIVAVFTDLKEGPLDDFRDPKLIKSFDRINNSEFPVNVVATMSSGKSTLINALLSLKLMPSKNEACTATITEILDNDKDYFKATAYDADGGEVESFDRLTYDDMARLNDDENVHRIFAEGDIPFLDSKSTALMLVDTPGPNNSQNQAHKNTTYSALNNDSNNLILYVLNGTQLSTNDDASLLNYVADQMKKGGKQVRDRFLFVINKMDGFNPEEEDIGKAVLSAKRYLARYGIEEPQIFPCSAYTALNIRTYLKDVDIDNMTRNEEKKLPSAARDTLPMIDKFIENESMHLEQYSTLSPSAQRELDYRLEQALEREDTKEQALIHCGIYSIEAAITAYVKKYAKTKKIKDLVESFQEVLVSNGVLARAKDQVATNEAAAKACAQRAAAIEERLADGKEAQQFKKRIQALNPLDKIKDSAEQLKRNAMKESSKIFSSYGLTITSKNEAERLVNQYAMMSSDAIAKMATELESVIHREVVETGEKILSEYQDKLLKFDEGVSVDALDFSTMDLIKGALTGMKDSVESWNSESFASETVNDVGETEYEERTWYEKVGEEEEEIIVGSHEEKIGTEKVKVGSHREKAGTRLTRNRNKRFLQFWKPKYVEEDVYETVDDYEDRDVYKTVFDYKTIMRDVMEKKTETIEKFSIQVSELQDVITSRLMQNLDEGIEDAKDYADDQIQKMKRQFMDTFDDLDRLIVQKYEEMNRYASDQKAREAELEKNRKLLGWIEACQAEIDEIVNL